MRNRFFDFVGDETMRRTKKVLFIAERPGLYAARVGLTTYHHPQVHLLIQKITLEMRQQAFDELYRKRHEIESEAQAVRAVIQVAPLGIRVTCPLPLRPLHHGAPRIDFEDGRLWVMRALHVLSISVAAALGVSSLSMDQTVEELLEGVVRSHYANPPTRAGEVKTVDQLMPLAATSTEPALVTATSTSGPTPLTPQADRTEPFAASSRAPHVQCPVCALPVRAPGRTRHQQCEAGAYMKETRADPAGAASVTVVAYRRLVSKVEELEWRTHGLRRETTSRDPIRLPAARQAVLLRCLGRCENPKCGGQPLDVTDDGQPILEVDHVQRIANGGRDHPSQMVALCPNCHAMKERGRNRAMLQAALADAAERQHSLWVKDPKARSSTA